MSLPSASRRPLMSWMHLYTRLVATASLLLIAAGGLVTSTGSGLAVPDWPNTYGYFMFSFPLSGMVGGILYEHGHRLIASGVGLLTIGLAVWLWRRDARRWVGRLGWIALAAVILQGLLGGLTVLYFLPPAISISHAGLAQIFFTLVVTLAIFTSPGWLTRYDRAGGRKRAIEDDRVLRPLAIATPAIIYVQILLGATMRHTGAGLAIPDFPLAFGRIIPPEWSAAIAIHFAHRLGALVATFVVLATAGHVLAHHRRSAELARPAGLLILVVLTQVTLGAWTVWSQKHVGINTAHVATGALLLVTSVVLALRVHRDRFPDARTVAQVSTRTVGDDPVVTGASGAGGG
jgi:cytochrome c oxidase assembly protein subunit 15